MNFIDFIKDHLINIDCLFDKHLPGDDQKPHQPFLFQHLDFVVFLPSFLQLELIYPWQHRNNEMIAKNDTNHFDYVALIFHPPDCK